MERLLCSLTSFCMAGTSPDCRCCCASLSFCEELQVQRRCQICSCCESSACEGAAHLASPVLFEWQCSGATEPAWTKSA